MSSPALFAFLIPTFFFFSFSSSAFALGSPSLLPEHHHEDYALDLNVSNFHSVLGETTATFAVVEFFAHWCPACRNYKPQYEKIAKIFNGAHPGIVLMTRVDCALKINTELCAKFSVDRYPMLLWGPPSKFSSGSWNRNQENSEIRAIDNAGTADLLLNWINKQMGSSYELDDEKYENNHQLRINEADAKQIRLAIHDIEEATAKAFDIILDHKMIKPATSSSLAKFFQLLVVHHPSRRCRKGTAEILVDFGDFPAKIYKEETASSGEKGVLGNYQICGTDVPRGYWMFCQGSRNETRGFSCGLWVLFHSLSVRVADEESQTAFTSICNFIHNFFTCQECRQHFNSMCSAVSSPFKTARDFSLWLWKAHNKVNSRLMKEEASLETGDPKYPKTIWPPRQLCPKCHISGSDGSRSDWNLDEVYRLLVAYYGKSLMSQHSGNTYTPPVKKLTTSVPQENLAASQYNGSTPHAVVIPLGAALAIAVASCAFGALAYYWHQKQKIRKARRSLKLTL